MASAEDLKKALSIDKFNVDPNESNASKSYEFWMKKFQIYTTNLKADDAKKLQILINKLDINTYEYVEGVATYNDAITKLDQIFKKKPNIIFARWILTTTRQNSGESIDAYGLGVVQKVRNAPKSHFQTDLPTS